MLILTSQQITDVYSQTQCLPDRLQDGCEWSYSNTSTNTHNDIVLEHILEKDKTQYSEAL